jgi:hypothetical protein
VLPKLVRVLVRGGQTSVVPWICPKHIPVRLRSESSTNLLSARNVKSSGGNNPRTIKIRAKRSRIFSLMHKHYFLLDHVNEPGGGMVGVVKAAVGSGSVSSRVSVGCSRPARSIMEPPQCCSSRPDSYLEEGSSVFAVLPRLILSVDSRQENRRFSHLTMLVFPNSRTWSAREPLTGTLDHQGTAAHTILRLVRVGHVLREKNLFWRELFWIGDSSMSIIFFPPPLSFSLSLMTTY